MEPKPKMDLDSECSILEVVEDNEEISNDSVPANLGNISESKVQNNVSCVVVNNDYTDLKPEMSPSPTRKGRVLRKWRRINRDAKKGGDSTINTGKMALTRRQLSNSNVSSSKRMQYAERKQKSEGSVSSTNAIVQSFDDLGLGLGPPFAAGTDSENSEDHSSKSSTAASAPRINYKMPVVSGFPRDRSRMRSLNGKNSTHAVQRGHQGKGRVETNKKARGEQVKIEKENSHSSLESDSRSSNFLFMQGTYSTNNGIRNERLEHYDGENDDEVEGSEQQVTDGHRGVYGGDDEGGYEGLSPEGGAADSSSEVKEERSENHGSSSDQDPLDESLFALEAAKEALEKEVLQFQKIGDDISVDDSVSDLGTEFIDDEQNTSSKQLSGEGVDSFSRALQSEVVETGNRDVEIEVEELFKQNIEAEVEYMAISRTVRKLRVAAVDQITVLKEQKALASEQTQVLHKLGAAENKAAVLKKDAEKLENYCEDIASADEIMKLQNRVCKYSSCFFVQLILLLVILGVFIYSLSPSYVEVVPT